MPKAVSTNITRITPRGCGCCLWQNCKSAYQLAQQEGYTGTEAEFIALLVRVALNDNIWLTEEEWDALQVKDPDKTYNIYEEL